MSGMMAGHLISSELLGKITEQQAIQQYCQWIHQWFRHDVENLGRLYAKLPNPPFGTDNDGRRLKPPSVRSSAV